MDKVLSFYITALGLEAEMESDRWSALKVTDGLQLGLHTREKRPDADKHPFESLETTLVVNVDDVDAYCIQVTESGGAVDRVIEPRDGIPVRMTLVRDPSGNGFQINQFVGG